MDKKYPRIIIVIIVQFWLAVLLDISALIGFIVR